jgi:hypothetical protein
MPAVDEPDARATLRLRLHVPRGWIGAASGREVSRNAASDGVDVVEWLQDRPVPAYTFGFSVGRFSEATDREAGVTLRYFANGFTPDEMQKIFGESRQMLRFFEERSGVPYPSHTYAQVLVARTCDWPSKRRVAPICASSSRALFAPRTSRRHWSGLPAQTRAHVELGQRRRPVGIEVLDEHGDAPQASPPVVFGLE